MEKLFATVHVNQLKGSCQHFLQSRHERLLGYTSNNRNTDKIFPAQNTKRQHFETSCPSAILQHILYFTMNIRQHLFLLVNS